MTKAMSAANHRKQLVEMRATTLERITRLTEEYHALAEAGTDVGSGEDEGGSEADGTFFERDRIRAQIIEDEALVGTIDGALARAGTKQWKTCSSCASPIGDARLEALPTTSLCVSCKATEAVSW